MYSIARPFLFTLDAERAHGLGLSALDLAWRTGTTPLIAGRIKPLPTTAFGLSFPNPVGLAAGLDKNGEHIAAASGQPQAAPVPPAAAQRHHQPHGFQQPRR
ncbi:MAG: hypothetical protein RSG92_28315 [Pseudomonas sp.]